MATQPAATELPDDGWNPRPDPEGTAWNTKAYMCGYTDAFFGEPFGSHDRNQYGAFSAYRPGYHDGAADRNRVTLACVAFAIISEKARFHEEHAEQGSNLQLGLADIHQIAVRQIAKLRAV